MRKIKSSKKYAALFLLVFAFSLPYAQCVSSDTAYAAEVQPKADEIRWRFKTVDGKVYKRLYNFSTKTWIGDWIPA